MFTLTIAGLTGGQAELAEAALEDNEPLAISRNETDETNAVWEIIAYFGGETEARRAAETLAPFGAAHIDQVHETDWVRRSLEGLPPVAAGRFYIHGSHDRPRRRTGGISLEIDAGTAFGTGHHPTTQGCLLAFDALLKRRYPRHIVDIGCGTGVLAIAAAKALHVPVLASDIDPEAVQVTCKNARLNGVAPLVRAVPGAGLAHPRIRAGAPYDLIFANILARPLVSLARELAHAVSEDSILILSGLTSDQSREVTAAYRNRGLALTNTLQLGSWTTLCLSTLVPRDEGQI
ncbi:MAG: 50S ribosomal protein L11 methyltransferase [Hyphomicrobiales bacterium]